MQYNKRIEIERLMRDKEIELCNNIHNDNTLLLDYREFIFNEIIPEIFNDILNNMI
jgi:hypothetical protein